MEKPVLSRILEERFQGHEGRKELYREIEKELGKPLVSYYTSDRYPVIIETGDAEVMEDFLRVCDLSDGLILMVSSLGGDGVAAERMTNVCKAFSGTQEYDTIVMGRAKSAATMICLGLSSITMSKTAELGAVDPILYLKDQSLSVFNVIRTYEELFSEAIETEGNLEPYLQQLSYYDPRTIKEMRQAMELSEDISIKALKNGMLSHLNEDEIKERIRMFLSPKETKFHGRPIYPEDAKQCGLNVNPVDIREKPWSTCYELHVRLKNFVSHNNVAKAIECKDGSFSVQYSTD